MKFFYTALVLLVGASIATVAATPVGAATPPDSCFAFDAGTGTITNYYDYEDDDSGNTSCARSVDIPESIGGVEVTSVGNESFYSSSLDSVTIPDSVTTIGSYAFAYNNLVEINIPDSVTDIGSAAFNYNYLTSVTIPDSVTTIGSGTFASNDLTSVTIPDSITNIGEHAFAANRLTSVAIPGSVVSIDNGAFSQQHPNLTREELGDLLSSSDPLDIQRALNSFAYTRLNVAGGNNPHGIQDDVEIGLCDKEGDGAWDDICVLGGHIINPAQLTLNYHDQSGESIRPSETFVGVDSDGNYISSYRGMDSPEIPMPDNIYAPTPAERQAMLDVLSAYWRLDNIAMVTAPEIDGYVTPTPAVQSTMLASNSNSYSFVYEAESSSSPEPTDPGEDEPTEPGDGGDENDGSDNASNDDSDTLADTGYSPYLASLVALGLIGAGLIAWRRFN